MNSKKDNTHMNDGVDEYPKSFAFRGYQTIERDECLYISIIYMIFLTKNHCNLRIHPQFVNTEDNE